MSHVFDPNLSPSARMAALLHHRKDRLARGEHAAPALISTSTFHLPGGPEAPFTYARDDQPTWREVEAQMSVLEQAECVAFPSGMAALAAVAYSHLAAGDRVIIPSDGYFAFRTLMQTWLRPLGVEVEEWPTKDMASADFKGAKLVFLETPSNPGLDVCDVRAVSALAHEAGAKVVVDNTTATPLLQRPLDLGADILVSSDTKAMSGHSDVLFGHVAAREEGIIAPVRHWRKFSGAVPGPFAAWLVHRGIETLEVRLTRMCENAKMLAERLADHPSILAMRYPGLPGDPSYEMACQQMDAGGFLIGVTLKSEAHANRFLDACRSLYQTTSFGGVHSSAERRARWGDDVSAGFVRFSAGIEPTEHLWRAVSSALDA